MIEKRIMLIDDSEEDLYAFERVFKESNLSTLISFSDAEESQGYLKDSSNAKPSIIIIDLNMPKIDGFEFIKFLKSSEDLACIPIIVLSTSNSEGDVEKAYRLGASSYITKPVDFGKFKSVVKVIQDYWLLTASLPK